MNHLIDITAGQFLGVAALALATGIVLGVSIGLKIYERFCR